MTIQDIQNMGIVGAGGAGFPTHIKLQSRPEFLILNAVECEPLLHKDKELLLNETASVLEGFRMAMDLTGARQGIIGIKAKHGTVLKHVQSKITGPIRIEPIGDFYPAGDEVTLVYLTTQRVVQPGGLPIHVGCLVQNVETLYNLACSEPVTGKWLTVTGAVEHPATVNVPIGVSFSDVLSHFRRTAGNTVIRSGGLMMGVLERDPKTVVTKTTGGLIVLPVDHPCAWTYEKYSSEQQTVRMAKAACDQCSFCTELCPRYLLGHPVRPELAMRNRMFGSPAGAGDPYSHSVAIGIDSSEGAGNPNGYSVADGIEGTLGSSSHSVAGLIGGPGGIEGLHPGNAFCCECNLCTLYACPEHLDPRGATVIEKKITRSRNVSWEGLSVRPHPMWPYRKVPIERLKQRLGIADFKDEGPMNTLRIVPDIVNIPLLQHVGSPAVPVVRKNDSVKRGQCIARANGSVSVDIHASIAGQIVEVNPNNIVIQRQP
jgi:Na+-translocating ferredoxin:NAD+ oxidoreductase RnfC subunit